MQIVRRSAFRTMPWKNGGGETTEIAVSPAGAGMESFDWRVSMARVASDGPFSLFRGIDRSLTVLDGDGLVLRVEGQGEICLTPMSPPFEFSGDAHTDSRLLGGPVHDLNVMTRRGAYAAKVERSEGPAAITLDAQCDTLLFLCRKCDATGPGVDLAEGDALVLPPGTPPLTLALGVASKGFVVRIAAVG